MNPDKPAFNRDPARTPMHWTAETHAGFSTVEPWLPVGNDTTATNVEAQRDDTRSMLSLTRALLRVRRSNEALSVGDYAPIEGAPTDCHAYERAHGSSSRAVVVLSFADEPRELTLTALHDLRAAVSTHMDRDEVVSDGRITLRAHEGCVFTP